MTLPPDPDLEARLSRAPAIPFVGHGFRILPGSAVVRNLTFDHLAARTSAGRLNPDGVQRLYLGAEKKTAQAEFRHHAANGGMNPDLAATYEFSVSLRLARVLDLTDGGVRRLLRVTLDELNLDWKQDPLSPPRPPTRPQVIGYWVAQGRGDFTAIMAPSVRRPTGRNLVLFPQRLGPGDAVTGPS